MMGMEAGERVRGHTFKLLEWEEAVACRKSSHQAETEPDISSTLLAVVQYRCCTMLPSSVGSQPSRAMLCLVVNLICILFPSLSAA
jgi:hypothetical protein